MSSKNSVLSLLGWSFLPNLISSWGQKLYYGITIRAGTPHPQPGTAKYILHRRRIQILVVSLYLAYTIYEADHSIRQEGNYYSDLGLPFAATEKEIRSRMRRLAAQHHPDKTNLRPDAASSDPVDSHNYFILLQRAAETLGDSAKRFAYERFGPDIHTWATGGRKFVTIRDYMTKGLNLKLPHYIVTAAVLYLMSVFNYLSFARWWRWTILSCVCIAELHLVTRSTIPAVLSNFINPLIAHISWAWYFIVSGGGVGGILNNASAATTATTAVAFQPPAPYLPFQFIQLLRQISLTTYIAFNQLGPLLQPVNQVPDGKEAEAKALAQCLDRLDQTVVSMNAESSRLIDMEVAPFVHDGETLKGLKANVKDWLVQNTVRTDPLVRDAVGNEIKKRRLNAPAGAKGNR